MQKKLAPKKSNKTGKISEKMKQEALPPFLWEKLTPLPIIGVDEVGRGCLAGPVYAAAVILPVPFNVEGVTDSKLISEKRREILSEEIKKLCQVSIAFATVEEIAQLNILHASLLAMKRAILGLNVKSGHVIVDGNQKVTGLPLEFKQTCVVKGDLRCQPIAAASIVAKVARDQLMRELGEAFPQYGFERHKGYSAKEHFEAIQAHGPCRHHRRTFQGVREYWDRLENIPSQQSLGPL